MALKNAFENLAVESKQDTGNTSLNNVDTNLGAKADASASSDTGTFSLISLFKRLLEKMTTLVAKDFATQTTLSAINTKIPASPATSANQQTDALTDTQLRATAVPVSGTVTSTPSGTQNVDVTANTIGLATSAKQLADNHQVTVSNSSIPVTDNGGSLTVDGTVGVSGTVASTQSGTWTVQPGNTANTTAWKVDGSAVTQPVSGTFWQATQPVSGTVTANAGTNLNTSTLATEATLAGAIKAEDAASGDGDKGIPAMAVRKATPANTSGTDGDYENLQMSAGRLWVDASGKTLTVDGSAVTQPVSLASVPSHAVTNAGTFATQATLQTGSNTIGALTANQTVDLNRIAGTATSVSNGVVGNGVQRVAIASDNTAFSVNAQPTPTGSSTQALSNDTSTAYESSSVTKASAGTVYGVTGYNSKTSAQFFQFFNSTTVPADATVPVITVYVSAQSNFSIDFGVYGRRFSTGIAWSNSSTGATKTIGSADMFVDVNYV